MNLFQRIKISLLSRKLRTNVYSYYIYRVIYFFLDLFFLIPIVILAIISGFKKKNKIGIGPTPVINSIYHKKCLKSFGYSVETFVDSIWHITDDFDYKPSKTLPLILQPLIPYMLFVRSIFKYNCIYIYFNGGPLRLTTFLIYLEPFLLKISKIKVVCMAFGSDVQVHTRIQNLKFKDTLSQDYPGLRLYKNQIDKLVTLWTNHADFILAGADWVEYLYYWDELILAHFAIDIHDWNFIGVRQKKDNETVNIIHAPNHRNIKGTDIIIDTIKELRDEGYNLELKICENLNNSELKKMIQQSDIVIDQLIVGFYAMFAIEAMASGKITICNIRNDFFELYEMKKLINSEEFPIVNANYKNLKIILKSLLDNRSNWNEISTKSRKYVEKNHSIEKIGLLFDKINKKIGVSKNGY